VTAVAAADRNFMLGALSLAARNLGDTWPNPSVGCVIAKDGVVVGRGWTQSGGRPHAESEAIKRAGNMAQDATAYVTLEPCSHEGQTPPCADALISAGIARVVVATRDRNPEVSGNGIEKLKAAGVQVETGACEIEAAHLNAGFFLKIESDRPLFALKSATTMDGRIALASGESKWITGEAARAAAHALRARYDAVLVGSSTVLADDPELTCRMPGYSGRPKVRIALDRRGRISVDTKLVKTAKEIPTWIITSEGTDCSKLADQGAEIIAVAAGPDAAFAANAAKALANKGLTRVMIEGGAAVAASFLQANLIDEILWFRAGGVIGADGTAGIGPLGLGKMADMGGFKRRGSLVFGPDTLDFLDRVHG
jgi:diaminohydroxyphosphoribosylaminopyrimidine deaminase / 5-amino-6-(5-phosphoribosylamino)uracil reductase